MIHQAAQSKPNLAKQAIHEQLKSGLTQLAADHDFSNFVAFATRSLPESKSLVSSYFALRASALPNTILDDQSTPRSVEVVNISESEKIDTEDRSITSQQNDEKEKEKEIVEKKIEYIKQTEAKLLPKIPEQIKWNFLMDWKQSYAKISKGLDYAERKFLKDLKSRIVNDISSEVTRRYSLEQLSKIQDKELDVLGTIIEETLKSEMIDSKEEVKNLEAILSSIKKILTVRGLVRSSWNGSYNFSRLEDLLKTPLAFSKSSDDDKVFATKIIELYLLGGETRSGSRKIMDILSKCHTSTLYQLVICLRAIKSFEKKSYEKARTSIIDELKKVVYARQHRINEGWNSILQILDFLDDQRIERLSIPVSETQQDLSLADIFWPTTGFNLDIAKIRREFDDAVAKLQEYFGNQANRNYANAKIRELPSSERRKVQDLVNWVSSSNFLNAAPQMPTVSKTTAGKTESEIFSAFINPPTSVTDVRNQAFELSGEKQD